MSKRKNVVKHIPAQAEVGTEVAVLETAPAEVAVAETAPVAEIVPVPVVATARVYKFGAKKPGPRTAGENGQASNTQLAWATVVQCINENGGQATHAQLTESLKTVNLQFKTYVPYFTSRCKWLALAN